jgi:hypothetical protein
MKSAENPGSTCVIVHAEDHLLQILHIEHCSRQETLLQTASVTWGGSNTQFMVRFTTLIFTATTGEELKGDHSAVVSRENV